MRRKLLAVVLALMLALSQLSLTAFAAEDGQTTEPSAPTETVEAEDETPTEGEDPVEDETPAEDATPLEEVSAEDVTPLEEVSAEEGTSATSGTCGENLTWSLDENGTLTISGTGPMKDYDLWEEWPWGDAKNSIVSVVIEPGVTSIGSCAFVYCESLTSVTIPDTVTNIGHNAFEGCNSLTSVTIPDSVTSIGDYVFFGCSGLLDSQGFLIVNKVLYNYVGEAAEVVIPDGVTTIGDNAFIGTGLTSVVIPGSVTSIEYRAFYNCDSLTSVTIPDSVTNIGGSAFEYCSSLTSVTLPSGLTKIADSAFKYSGLTSLSIPNSVTSIEYRAFYNCDSLTSVTIPDSVKSIGETAFGDCDILSSAVLGGGVEEIGAEAFFNDPVLTNVMVGNAGASIGENAIGMKGNEAGVEPVAGAAIYGYIGSTAQTYADTNTVTFVPINSYTVQAGTAQYDYIIDPEVSSTIYVQGSGGDITIYCTGQLKDFVRLLVDGVEVDPANYQLTEGSTIVTLLSAYLDTLAVGQHTVKLEFTNGTAESTITIQARAASKPSDSGKPTRPTDKTPQTSDIGWMGLWLAVAAVSGTGLLVLGGWSVAEKNKRKS